MRRLLLNVAILLSYFTSFAYAQTNTINLTSYYPAPFGAYERLRLFPQNPLNGQCDDGSLYFEDTNNTLQICRNNLWGPITGLWSMTPQFDPLQNVTIDQYFLSTNYPDLTVRKPFLGIGTNNPQSPVHIVINNTGKPEALIIDNQSKSNDSEATFSFSGILNGVPTQNYVDLRAVYKNTHSGMAESSLSILLRDGTGTGMIEQFTFKGNGLLGIRNPAPLSVLDLAGNAIDPPGLPVDNNLKYLNISTNAVPANSGNVLTVLANGNVGINQQNPTQLLEIDGNIKATTLILTSDAVLKENIAPLTNALDKISRLKGVSFEWKDNTNDTRKHMGVIAQDVEKVFPEIVYGQEGAKGVDYPSLIAPLIEAVKELKTKNDVLSQELLKQSALISTQEEQIKSLENSFTDQESLATH